MSETTKAGKLLCVDRGAYSDYNVTGFFLVLSEFSPKAELESYLRDHEDQRADYSFEPDEFLSYLIGKGFLLEIDYGTLYLGSYGSHSDLSFRE